MDLSIITVNTNDKEKILEQLKSVPAGVEGLVYEYFVTDNGSTDSSIEIIKNQYPEVKVIANKKNIGFGAANNVAIKQATGEFVLFLNPDMRLEARSLKKIVDWMRTRAEVGVVSCKLIDEDGKFNENAKPRRFPTLLDQVAILLKLPHLFPKILDHYLYKGFDSEQEQEVDSVRGSFMLIRKELTNKLGWGFDPRYFIWFEDVDTCREAWANGYKVMYTPIISCVDYVGQNFKRLPSLLKQKWFTASMVKYFRKWEPWYKWLVIAILRPVAIGLVWVESKFKN
ncbi:MAG: Glycosyl transferase family 2 [Candidatus Magasanikbacteria bacterium GW2011_GWA2_37_8]|uniref:Glycosyl transferase family 2 n=1 Tax=Candidatus Magasanikbacteria bacterium GW2011_GWA2_37_8 TaxID=1619036 RepID=A0A0G0H719_9BACT|nr:MAG: Glycosyl transferase family 2 [Candidatus Magasanikbacteria bacterium GW2011_GWA2_37_8]